MQKTMMQKARCHLKAQGNTFANAPARRQSNYINQKGGFSNLMDLYMEDSDEDSDEDDVHLQMQAMQFYFTMQCAKM